MEERTFAQLGRVEAVRQLFEGSGYKPFAEPVAFVAKAGETCVSAAKTFIEGTDFDLVYFPLKHLGGKAVVAVTGELYAAMAHPRTLSVVLGVSAKLDFAQVSELWSGVVAAAKEHGYTALSLDLIPSRNGLSINVSASGALAKLTAARMPAPKSKDLLCVSGSLGAAFLGLQLLERERVKFEQGAGTVGQLEDGEIYPSSGVFVTKGLSDAVFRIARASGLGAKIYADKIPFEGGSFAIGKEMDLDPVSAAMNGGEDYKLLFTVPILQLEKFRKDFQTFDIIGHLPLTAPGWPRE